MIQRLLERLQSLKSLRERYASSRVPQRLLAGRRSLRVESLEQRRVLTAGTAEIVDGVLTVCGDDDANTIVVAELETQYFVFSSALGGSQLFDKAEVDSVQVLGGGGDDTIVTTSMLTPVTINGEDGNDRIFGGQVADVIDGGAGDDLIFGNNGDDVIFGRAGSDVVIAGNGADIVNGGDDNDAIAGNDGDDRLNGDSGNDTISGSGGNDTVTGGVGNDTLTGGAGDDMIEGNAGDDIITGDGDSDQLQGNEGNDRLLGSGADDLLIGGDGDDVLVGGLGDDFLDGSAGADQLFGDSGGDTIFGNGGDDLAFGGTGPDEIFGGDGVDSINGGNGFDALVGGNGADQINGGNDRDILIGGEAADTLNGQGADDLLISGSTSVDISVAGLEDLRDAWTPLVGYDQRVADALSDLEFVHDDVTDIVSGGNGQDLFVADSVDAVTDQSANEVAAGDGLMALSDTYEVAIGETLTTSITNGVLANDLSGSGSGDLTVTLISDATHSPVTLNADGTFSYTQTAHAHDTFTYEVRDELGETSQATVTLTVSDIPQLPAGATLATTASGLQVFDFSAGSGATPERSDRVRLGYVGYLPNGAIFDSNESATFPLTGVIEGFAEGVEGMQVGGVRRIAIPPELGYGSGGNSGAGIGGTDIIIFDVTLHEIL